MKRILLIFTLFNIVGVASAQLKSYNGFFEDGSANYTYKEEGLTRIFEGNFSYKSADGKKSMSGRYADDMKTGLWKTDWCGFHEEANYKQGLKHGIYKLRYKNSNNEMKIDAHFTQGDLDSLSFKMKTSDGRVMGGRQDNLQETMTLGIWELMVNTSVHNTFTKVFMWDTQIMTILRVIGERLR